MKKTTAFISLSLASAFLAGLASVGILLSIIQPAFSNMMLIAEEAEQLEFARKYFFWLMEGYYFLIAIGLILGIAIYITFLYLMVPMLRIKYLKRPIAWVYVIAVLLFISVMYSPDLFSSYFVFAGLYESESVIPSWLYALISVVAGGATWAVAGLMLWPQTDSQYGIDKRVIVIVGMTAGFLVYLIMNLSNSTIEVFSDYFFYVYAGDYDVRIYSVIWFSLIETSVFLLAVLAVTTIIIALSLDKQQAGRRFCWAGISAVACALLLTGSLIVDSQYDKLTRPFQNSMLEAAGVEKENVKNYSLLLLGPAGDGRDLIAQRWPLKGWLQNSFKPFKKIEFDYSNPETWNNESYPLTITNLDKLEDFSARIPYLNEFWNAYRQSIVDGYFNMLEIKTGRRKMLKQAKESLIMRILFYRAMGHAQTTPENKALIMEFAQLDWQINQLVFNSISKLLYCSGLKDEARQWVNEHGSVKVDEIDIDTFKCRDFVEGRMHGKVALKGITLDNLSMIIYNDYAGEMIEKMEYDSFKRRADITELGPDGEFEFAHLRGGYYYLVLVDKEGRLSEDESAYEITNNPGFIIINSTTPNADLGTIVITVK